MPLLSTNRGHIDEDRIRIIVTRLFESLGNEKSIWEYYNEMAAVEDNIREVEWRDLADTVLIFDGLFAAFLSAFLVFLIPQLQPNSTDVALDVLIHISQQLSNTTTPAFVPPAFQVSSNVSAMNTLFFLSLAFVLIDAFLAMLVKGWLQEFDRGWRMYTVAHLRAQERERRLHELERWKLHELVALLPILIQVSLLLFCIGLIVLIFPLHFPSAISSIVALVSVVGFYCFTTYVSTVNKYAPFSSPVSRLLMRGLAALQTSIARNTRHVVSAGRFHNREPRTDTDPSDKVKQSLPSDNGVAEPPQAHNAKIIEKSKVGTGSRSNIDPQMHVHVLERLVSTTAEAVENIPVFLELLDQPVKDTTLRPLNMEKWKKLFHITFGLLKDQQAFPVLAACTLARTMMICYNREIADQQLVGALQYHLSSRETHENRPRVPFNLLFSSYFSFWLDRSFQIDLYRSIAFLEPSGAADAELFWMVNTFHTVMHSWYSLSDYFGFCIAVLTYVSSTEQCRRSQVPLTAAVIYALHTIRSAHDQGDTIDDLYILPGTVTASKSVLMTFSQVNGVDALNLWSEECIQFVKDLLQWHWFPYPRHDVQLPLIAALYIDSIKQAHARSTFADLLRYTSITGTEVRFAGAYDDGKLAAYLYMAVSQTPIDQDRYPLSTLYDVVRTTITEYTTLRLSGLHILDLAVKYLRKTASPSSDWLKKKSPDLLITAPDQGQRIFRADHWVLLHLDTLLAPNPYFLPEEVMELKWSDTPEEVYIAGARLDLYDSLASAEYEGVKGPKPDPELLRVLLWSKDYEICTRAFRWCLDLVPISLPSTLGDTDDSTRMFIPETMGSRWVEHFIHVLCRGGPWEVFNGDCLGGSPSLEFLISHLVPKWTMLPSSWCCDFASTLLFCIVHPLSSFRQPAYQYLAASAGVLEHVALGKFLGFVGTLLGFIKSGWTWARLSSFENCLNRYRWRLESQNVLPQIELILTTVKQQLTEETLLAGSWTDE